MKKSTELILVLQSLAILPSSAQLRPNIIVFTVDDMGLMDTSLPFLTDEAGRPKKYPLNDWYRTPNMERLARQGIRFSTFYAQSVSSPSRTSIMTGQNAARHRTTNWINAESNNRTVYGPLDWNWEGIHTSVPVYPKLLQAGGYRTIHIGKAHFGCQHNASSDPVNVGFDVNIGGSSIGHPGAYYGEYGYGWIKGQRARAVPHLEKYHRTETFLTEALTLEAVREMEKAVGEGCPFYLNLSHYAVHAPFQADPRFLKHYEGRGRSQAAVAFATLIEGMDKSLGDVMDKLEELGVAENTLIIFLGDNGSDAPLGGPDDHASSAPLRGKKGAEYEGGMRVPFIMAWAAPDADNRFQKRYPIASNAIQQQMATVMDIYPTVLSVARLEVPKGHILDGNDLKRLVQGKRDRKHRKDFLMHFPHEHRGSYFTVYRKGDWKLIYYYNPSRDGQPYVKLFRLDEDPFERDDLSDRCPDKVRVLFHEMKKRLEVEGACYPVNQQRQPVLPDWKGK